MNRNNLVELVYNTTDLSESSEDITRAISSLSVGLEKNEFWALFFRKSGKYLWEYLIFTLVWEAMKEKYLWKH